MGKEFGLRCPGESWKLLSIVGVTFALAVTFQYIELPYGTFWPSSSKAIGQGISTSVAHETPEVTHTLNSTILHTALEDVADTADVSNGIVDQEAKGLNDSSRLQSGDHGSSDEGSVPTNVNATFVLESSSSNSSLQAAPDDVDPEDMTENVDKDLLSERFVGLDNSTGFQNHDDGSSDQKLVMTNANSTLVPEKSLADASLPAPKESSNNITNLKTEEANGTNPAAPVDSVRPAAREEVNTNQVSDAKPDNQKTDISKADATTSPKKVAQKRRKPDVTIPAVLPISEMNKLILQSWTNTNVISPRWPSAADQQLRRARSEIEHAPIAANDPILYAPIYRNVSMFKRSYELMENLLKVYVYKEGERPVFHQPALKGIYASEGWFMKQLETHKKFVTRDARKAHLFYLPFGSRNLEEALYVPNSHKHTNLIQYLKDYLDMVSAKHPFWNRTDGADHFLVACHDWAPSETRQYMSNCIRALCNADVKEGFVFGKDSSLPETYVRNPQKLLKDIGGQSPSKRSILAFYAGNMHGYVRPILLEHWLNKDPDMKIYGVMPKAKGNKNYIQHMRSSKYCICPKGYEVNSPRVVEAIFHECVPVIISDNFVPPFFEVLNWESFAVFVLEKDIPNLKNILASISERRYLRMQMRVRRVQQHFLWHPKPVKYDIFHMILHSIWYNRVFRT
ncbi:Probable glycosyltransferase At5g03795 [Linum perenne]